MNENLLSILLKHYHIDAAECIQQAGGWASLAYKVVDTNDRLFFLKVYEKKRISTEKLTASIDDYMPIVGWLNKNTSLKGQCLIFVVAHPVFPAVLL